MVHFQPLITSAFATYTVRKPTYIEQRSAASDPQDVAGLRTAGVAPIDRNSALQKTEKTQKVEQTRDDGKPHSASGDVLDLSSEYRKTYNEEVRGDTKSEQSTVQTDDEKVELTPEEQEQVEKLKVRDAEVRIHEQTHLAAAGQYATGGPTYTYQTGPDGKRYAIGGEVGIDTSEISGDPEATIQKMRTIAAAALAPTEPSGQDQKVAAAARQKEAQARTELAKQRTESNGQQQSDSVEPNGSAQKSDAAGNITGNTAETAKSSVQKSGNPMFSAAYRSQSNMSNVNGDFNNTFTAGSFNTVKFSAFV